MNKFYLYLLYVIFFFNVAFGVNITIDAKIYKTQTILTYNIDLGKDKINSFSLEKEKDSIVELALGENEKLSVSSAGDFFIFKSKKSHSKFQLKILSSKISKRIIDKGTFTHYVKFNFPIDYLEFRVLIPEKIGDIKDTFPKKYEILSDGSMSWKLKNVNEEKLFLINFENIPQKNSQNSSMNFLILIMLLPIILFVILFYIVKKISPDEEENKKIKKKKTKPKKPIKKENEKNKIKIEDQTIKNQNKSFENKDNSDNKENIEIMKEKKFNEILNKYLTENEKEIVNLIKNNEGISQYDILNYLPNLTKSNLSKIISKLNSKRILNRIRVGKVNKIYLGEVFEIKKEENK